MSTKIKGRFSKIVVGIDGSESSMDAADYATEIAKKDGAEVIALSVNRLPLSSYGLADPQDEVKQSKENEEMQEFRELLDKVSLNAKQSNVLLKKEIINSQMSVEASDSRICRL